MDSLPFVVAGLVVWGLAWLLEREATGRKRRKERELERIEGDSMAQRLSDEQLARFRRYLEESSTWQEILEESRRPEPWRPPNLTWGKMLALLADLEEAREHRRILREAVELMLRVRAAVSKPDPSVDTMLLGDVWRKAESALAATEQEEKTDGRI